MPPKLSTSQTIVGLRLTARAHRGSHLLTFNALNAPKAGGRVEERVRGGATRLASESDDAVVLLVGSLVERGVGWGGGCKIVVVT